MSVMWDDHSHFNKMFKYVWNTGNWRSWSPAQVVFIIPYILNMSAWLYTKYWLCQVSFSKELHLEHAPISMTDDEKKF